MARDVSVINAFAAVNGHPFCRARFMDLVGRAWPCGM